MPRSNGFGATSTDYKEYGIGLDLHAPTVDRDGNVTTELETQVSRLDWGNAVTKDGYRMPGIATRSAYTTVNIPSGMTMVIGGLIGSDESRTLSKIPFLGDLPILGAFFRSVRQSRSESEIMIFLTAHVIPDDGST